MSVKRCDGQGKSFICFLMCRPILHCWHLVHSWHHDFTSSFNPFQKYLDDSILCEAFIPGWQRSWRELKIFCLNVSGTTELGLVCKVSQKRGGIPWPNLNVLKSLSVSFIFSCSLAMPIKSHGKLVDLLSAAMLKT